MNVYDHIAANNRKSVMIILVFPVALLAMIFLTICVVESMVRFLRVGPEHTTIMGSALGYTLEIFPWVLLGALTWMALAYLLGGVMVLCAARARQVTPDENRDLFRLVENTAIMAGLPTPSIYLIDSRATNAFATGRNPEAATIALTTGIVEQLTKTELQAVIAHELAHIGNRDTRLMMLVVAGIGFFSFIGELLCSGTDNAGRRVFKPIHPIGIMCLIFGYLVAPIIRAALSRRREFQADATAAKITRDPEALARALEKISFNPSVACFDASPLVGNMCIDNPVDARGLASFESKLYATHPPIEARVAALENMMGIVREQQAARTPVGKAVW